MGGDQGSLTIATNKKYRLYLGNESNTITKLFDTGFACDGDLHSYIYNVLYGNKTYPFISN